MGFFTWIQSTSRPGDGKSDIRSSRGRFESPQLGDLPGVVAGEFGIDCCCKTELSEVAVMVVLMVMEEPAFPGFPLAT